MNINLKFVSYNLGIVAGLIAAAMMFSLLWAFPVFGGVWEYEARGFYGLLYSILISGVVSGSLLRYGWNARKDQFFRRETIMIVAFSWIMAAILGAFPYLFSQTARDLNITPDGSSIPVYMSIADAIFEAQSGFSTTGATVICVLDHPELVPRVILFWRSTTHFMGGLGIIVLLVTLLDTGLAGKFLMQGEITGPLKTGNTMTRMRQTALCTTGIYVGFCVVVILLLKIAGLSFFDAFCHGFGTVATGGFSTHDTSIAYFRDVPGVNLLLVEGTVAFFSFLCGMNLLLLFFFLTGKSRAILSSPEWRVYIILVITATFVIFGTAVMKDHLSVTGDDGTFQLAKAGDAFLTCFFHVVALITTTGYITTDYNTWSSACLGVFILLMFTGACAGSTSGGIKLVRAILFFKILRMEFDRAYRPTIIRPLRYGNEIITDESVPRQLLVFLLTAFLIVLITWILVIFIEPDDAWINNTIEYINPETKLLDLLVATLSMFGNIGPAIGLFGPTGNYTALTDCSKLIFSVVMMLGRLEIFAVLTLFVPQFWRK
ncbi:MAG: TrkH family potassium uptake protein [Planctomycetia bacterium]|nr:TrkH family potassium uptake protein [Planctomycetia bacterium]